MDDLEEIYFNLVVSHFGKLYNSLSYEKKVEIINILKKGLKEVSDNDNISN